jgi:hypothetical protein
MGLIDELKKATKPEELDSLMQTAAKYKEATISTKRRWLSIYNTKKKELALNKPN